MMRIEVINFERCDKSQTSARNFVKRKKERKKKAIEWDSAYLFYIMYPIWIWTKILGNIFYLKK